MTTSAVYDLIPNYDNTQHTQYPQGDKPEETLIQTPTNLQTSGETLTSVDTTWDMVDGYHTHFILQRWRLNTDTAWTEITQPDELDRAYTDSADLLEGQHVGYRIAASDGTNQSDWSTEAWTYLLYIPTGDTDLNKIAWTADWSDLVDGTQLSGAAGESYGVENAGFASVSSIRTLNGRKSARETVGPDDIDADGAVEWMGFEHTVPETMKPAFGEVGAETWFRVYFYNEAGYTYECGVGHRKTMRLGEQKAGGGYAGGFCDLKVVSPDEFYGAPVNSLIFIRESATDTTYSLIDKSGNHLQENEKWQCLEMYVKSGDENNGEFKAWLDGEYVGGRQRQTMINADGRLERLIYIGYWNSGIPYDVTQSWCAPAIAVRNSKRDDTPHLDRDANGFPFIGLAT